ncbi:DUF1707 SHOCT-like domain-containing protein [Actinokineospora sp.]|uniref:DUF1707 SHOCT-like domain-containing protein n=1 Tax=Actinokineospora sp. TaxID=1872133 RepID=UPI00403834E5
MGTGRDANIRIGTTDRERAIAALADHLSAGRLDVAEYEQRCGTAVAARTRADLIALFADLPAPHPAFSGPPTSAVEVARRDPLVETPGPRGTKPLLLGFLGVAVVAVVTVTAITGAWWTLAPVLLIGLFVVLVS